MFNVPSKYHWPITLSCLALLIGMTMFLRLNYTNTVMPDDNYLYAYVGHAMALGEKLNIDLVDNKPPAIYVTHMIAEKLWGYREEAYIYGALVFCLVSLIFIFLILNKTHGKTAGLIGTLFGVLVFSMFGMDFDFPNTEFYVGTFLLIAIWAWLQDKSGFLWITGSAMAFATAYKTNAVFILMAWVVAQFLLAYKKNEKCIFPTKSLIQLIVPTLVFWGTIALYYYLQNSFAVFWDINIIASKAYAGNIWLNEWKNLISGKLFFPPNIKNVFILIILSYSWIVLNLLYGFPKKLVIVFSLLFIGCLVMTGSVPGATGAQYYHHQRFPLFSLMATMFCFDIKTLLKDKLNFKRPWLAPAGMIVLSVVLLGFSVKDSIREAANPSLRVNINYKNNERELGLLLKTLTEPSETIYQWGWWAQTYFFSQRKAASGIVTTHIFYFCPELRHKLYSKLIRDIEKSRPAFIVINAWTGKLDQQTWMQPFWPRYSFFGMFGKSLIFEKRGRSKPAKEILARIKLSPKQESLPWENPRLELFPGMKSTPLMDYERFFGKPILPTGNGPEASLVNQALDLFQKRQHLNARDILTKAIEINTNSLPALAAIATFNEASGQYYLALENYQTLAEKLPHPFIEYYLETKNLLMQEAAMLAQPDQ